MFTDNDNKKTDLEKQFDELGNVSDTALVTPTEISKKIEVLNEQLEKEEKLCKEQSELEEKLLMQQLEKGRKIMCGKS